MAIKIYSKEVDIQGLDKPFMKVCTFSKKSGIFHINYPVNKYDQNLIDTAQAFGRSLEEVENDWQHKVDLFELQYMSTEEVILYQYKPNWSTSNGAGVGFIFNWGIFKKLIRDHNNHWDNSPNRYFYLRVGVNADGDHLSEHNAILGEDIRDRKEFTEIPCTPEAEKFFTACHDKLWSFHCALLDFFTKTDFENLPKALPFNIDIKPKPDEYNRVEG